VACISKTDRITVVKRQELARKLPKWELHEQMLMRCGVELQLIQNAVKYKYLGRSIMDDIYRRLTTAPNRNKAENGFLLQSEPICLPKLRAHSAESPHWPYLLRGKTGKRTSFAHKPRRNIPLAPGRLAAPFALKRRPCGTQ
jgi:hypothetical protein